MTYRQILLIIYVIYIVLMSFFTLILFKKDKKRAIKGDIRIKEKSLLFSSAFGGGLSALIGRIMFHHKTDKKYFSIVIYLSTLCEILVLILLLIGGLK